MRGIRRSLCGGLILGKYRRLEYIKNESSAYIDTGYAIIDNNFVMETKYSFIFTDSEQKVAGCGIHDPAALYDISCGRQRYSKNMEWILGDEYYLNGIRSLSNDIYITRLNIPKLITTVFNLSEGTSQTIHFRYKDLSKVPYQNWFLFTASGYYPQQFHGKLYYTKMWHNNKLIRDFIPVQRLSGEMGMLDKVEGKFYTSPNGVAFNGK